MFSKKDKTDDIEKVISLLAGLQGKRILVITGAGISAPSGIPTFRGKKGLWRNPFLMSKATFEYLERNPVGSWNLALDLIRICLDAKPNAAHRTLVEMESLYNVVILTQNIDELHTRAGSTDVCEMHGNTKMRCFHRDHGAPVDIPSNLVKNNISNGDEIPKCPECGRIMRPNVLLFGEWYPPEVFDKVERELGQVDAMLSIGSSGAISGIIGICMELRTQGVPVVEFNIKRSEMSYLADHFVRGDVSETLPRIWKAIAS